MRSNGENAFAEECKMRGDEWKALEKLPPAVRRALHEATVNWSPLPFAKSGRDHARRCPSGDTASFLVGAIESCDRGELSRASRDWRERHGAEYPHVAAGATPIRYDEAAIVRARRG